MPENSWALKGTPHLSDTWQQGRFAYTEDGFLRYVLAVIENPDGSYMMLKSRKHNGRFQCPGGKIDFGESAPQALEREITEELGCSITIEKPLGTRKVYAGGTLWQGEYYLAKTLGKPQIMEAHKHDGLWRLHILADSNIATGFQISASRVLPTNTKQNLTITDPAILDETFDAIALSLWQTTANLEQNQFRIFHDRAEPPELSQLKKLFYIDLSNGYKAIATDPTALPHNARIIKDFPALEFKGVTI